ncbi:hypothetical protein O181_019847 [Austropuccinia psidii MF-1]|uniref:Uncharacterized protein n=1 Tax=Austropuccinia psidii MF-1 TaxID=1389203 RepID=A0A9Q3GUT8_9BASI|nr:hypothetical protein [Austropuccinia psidii MF-1]
MQILTPIQDPNTLHVKICPREASQQLQHFLMLVQAPNVSHANPHPCTGSQQFKQLLTPGQASDDSNANPYAWTGSQCFTCTSLHFYRFPTIHTIPYAGEASQKF